MRRRGFTIAEALIATGLSTIVLGTGLLMWMNGSKSFTKATQHSSVREQALLILERVNRDIDGLIVSQEINPRTKKHYMVQPFELLDVAETTGLMIGTKPIDSKIRRTGKGIRFHVYHRTEMVRVTNAADPEKREEKVEEETDEREEPEGDVLRLPRVVGRYIEYRSQPSQDGKGVDLLRNGQKVNLIPLAEVRFERGDPVHAVKTLGASPNAVLRVVVVPRAGIEGELGDATVKKQDDVGTALSRVFHLVGYESQYTALLGVALERFKAKEKLDPVELAVMRDAKIWGVLEKADEKLNATPIRYRLPESLIRIESDKPYDTANRPDPEFSRAETRQGGTMAAALKRGGISPGKPSAGSSSSLGGAP